jgi:predicted nucleic acid-binding protein
VSKPTAFWDASALVPLCIQEATTDQVRKHLQHFSPVVWWGTVIEIHSAIARLHREAAIAGSERDGAFARLSLLSQGWREILPDDALREVAGTLLDSHLLRASDSLQLASALIWCRHRPQGKTFVCGDKRLSDAAKSTGFEVAELSRRTR